MNIEAGAVVKTTTVNINYEFICWLAATSEWAIPCGFKINKYLISFVEDSKC